MKKYSILTVLLFMLSSFAIQAVPVGRVSFILGKVSIKAPGASWKAIKVGEYIPANSVIQTGFKAMCRITLNKQMGDITLKPLSVFSVSKMTSRSDGLSGSLKSKLSMGSMLSRIRKKGGFRHRFKVFTPTATAAVRGTRFELSSYPDFGTTLRVLESVVDLLQLPPVAPGADPLISGSAPGKSSGELYKDVAGQMDDDKKEGSEGGFAVGSGEQGKFDSNGDARGQYDDVASGTKVDFNSGGLSSAELDALLESAFGSSDIGSILEFFSEFDKPLKKVRPITFKKL